MSDGSSSDPGRHTVQGGGSAPADGRTEYPAPHRGARLLPALAVVLVVSFFLGGMWAMEAFGDSGALVELVLWGGGFLVIFGPMGLYRFLKRRSKERLILDEDGVEMETATGRPVRMRWREVTSLRWGGFLSKGLILSDRRGARRIAVDTHFDGFNEIAERLVARVVEAHRADPARLSPPSRFRRSPWAWVPVWVLVLGSGVTLALVVPYGWMVPAVLTAVVLPGQLGTMGRVVVENGWLLERGGLRWRRTPLRAVQEVALTPPRSFSRGERTSVDFPAVELRMGDDGRKVAHAARNVLALWAAVEIERRDSASGSIGAPPSPPRGVLAAGLLTCLVVAALFSLFGIWSGAFLQTAVFFGSDHGIRLALALGSDPDTHGLFYDPPLYMAVRSGSPELVTLLLEEGADPSVRDPDAGFTPLHRATRDGEVEIVRILLDAGADVHATTWRDSTPLSQAVYGGHPELVRILHGRGADLDHPGPSDQTPLNYAIRSEAWEMVDLLLELGARPDIPDVDGFTPFQLAASRGYAPAVRAFLDRGVDPDLKGRPTATAVALAASTGHADIVALLLDHGADPTATVEGRSLAEAAREDGHEGVLEVLRERGLS